MMAEGIVDPPWEMQGQGWIMVCQWPRRWLIERGWVPSALADRFLGGPGAIMLVDYRECPIGPYRELLMVPGRFRTPVGPRPSITRILVSTQVSVDNGRRHWAIPKTLGHFAIEAMSRGERWTIEEQGRPLARFELRSRGPALPVSTRWSPSSWSTLAQPSGDRWLLTQPAARGRVALARLEASWCDELAFPQLDAGRRLLTARVSGFQMRFNPAQALD